MCGVDPRERAAQAASAVAELTGVARHDATVVIGSGWDAAAEPRSAAVGHAAWWIEPSCHHDQTSSVT